MPRGVTFFFMTNSLGFPSPAAVETQTPPDRDRAIDVIRIVALLGVIVGHTVMATSLVDGDSFVWGNILTLSVFFQAMTWVFQIMPLFFFAGVAASVAGWHPGISWGGWLMKRCTRLYRPVFFYLAFWAAALIVLYQILPGPIAERIAGISTQLLWFLGAYVLVLATVPLLARITTVTHLVFGMASVIALMAAVDYVRLTVSGMELLGFANLTVWLIPGMLGVAYRRKLLSPRGALGMAAAAFAVNVGLLVWGPYELSLVGIDGMRLANMFPPSLLMAGHAIILCGIAIAAAPAIDRWAQRPRVWWLTVIGNSGAMTLYLWHMPALLGMHLLFDYAGFPRYPGEQGFVVLSIVQVVVMAALVAALFVALRPLENNPLPGWDGAGALRAGARSAMVGTLLCVAGAATLASVKWGLKGTGLELMALMVLSLAAARVLCTPGRAN